MKKCQAPGCPNSIPAHRLKTPIPAKTCSPTCGRELRKERNKDAQARWYARNPKKKMEQVKEYKRQKKEGTQ